MGLLLRSLLEKLHSLTYNHLLIIFKRIGASAPVFLRHYALASLACFDYNKWAKRSLEGYHAELFYYERTGAAASA